MKTSVSLKATDLRRTLSPQLEESSKNKGIPHCSSPAALPHLRPAETTHITHLISTPAGQPVSSLAGYITASEKIAPCLLATVALIPQLGLRGKPLEDSRPVRLIDQGPRTQTLVQYHLSPRSTCLPHVTWAPLCMIAAYLLALCSFLLNCLHCCRQPGSSHHVVPITGQGLGSLYCLPRVFSSSGLHAGTCMPR